jgi:hypothetical protein
MEMQRMRLTDNVGRLIRTALGICAVALMFAATCDTAYAWPDGNGKSDDAPHGKAKGQSGVPEIDAGVAAGAVTLLTGGVLLLATRRRRESAAT